MALYWAFCAAGLICPARRLFLLHGASVWLQPLQPLLNCTPECCHLQRCQPSSNSKLLKLLKLSVQTCSLPCSLTPLSICLQAS